MPFHEAGVGLHVGLACRGVEVPLTEASRRMASERVRDLLIPCEIHREKACWFIVLGQWVLGTTEGVPGRERHYL